MFHNHIYLLCSLFVVSLLGKCAGWWSVVGWLVGHPSVHGTIKLDNLINDLINVSKCMSQMSHTSIIHKAQGTRRTVEQQQQKLTQPIDQRAAATRFETTTFKWTIWRQS